MKNRGWGGQLWLTRMSVLGNRNSRSQAVPECGQTATLWRQLHVVWIELREGVRRRLFKSRKSAPKHEIHFVSGAVALLGNPEFRFFPLFRRRPRLEEMRPVNEHHHVRILFDGAGLAQIRKLRPAFVALRCAR